MNEDVKKLFEFLQISDNDSKWEKYSIGELEKFALNLYENSLNINHNDILDSCLFVRALKIDRQFEWTDENKEKLLKVNAKFMEVFEKSYSEAMKIAEDLANKINNNDPFLHDFELELKFEPFVDKGKNDNCAFDFYDVLNENPTITYHISYNTYKEKSKTIPLYLDRSYDWGKLTFGNTFEGTFICYEIHQLLDTNIWSIQDIVDITGIWTDIEVIHQSKVLL